MLLRFSILPFAVTFFLPAYTALGVDLRAGTFAVELDPAFPRIIRYTTDQGVLDGQVAAANVVELNGHAETCRVSFCKLNAGAAEYKLAFPDAAIAVTLRVTVGKDAVELRVTGIKENGATKLKTFAFPGNALLSLGPAQPDAAIATAYCVGYGGLTEKLGPLPIRSGSTAR